ncbi:MAG: metal-dependent amidase/aminoacylase/carboxypeptidase [Geobacteraceae bacterium]|nr:metal-dependent amidase/aminoacylase/carboxypeptidase [Geobacteraceae bacterium]
MRVLAPGHENEGPGREQIDRIAALAGQECESLLELYRHLHAHPELSGQEVKTSRRLAEELEGIGFSVTQGVGGYGVVGIHENGDGPVIMVRADLDALPIEESTGLAYASNERVKDPDGWETGIMHACGHDIHIAVLVGTARLLMRSRNEWKGTLILVGQPAEETGTGAVAMLEDGLFSRFPRPDCILGLHVAPPMVAGKVGYCEEATMAGCASLDLRIRGVGGHGSRPHEVKDPVVMAAETVLLLQTIVSREVDPRETAVVSVGSIHGGARSNIIPDEVFLKINYRYFSPEVDRQIMKAIERIVTGVAVASGVPEDRMPLLTTRMTGPPIYSDPGISSRMAGLFTAVFGRENVLKLDPWSASDDFAHFGFVEPKIPLFYFWLGVADPEKVAENAAENRPYPGIHNPAFAPLAEPAIKTGVQAMAWAVLDLLRGR